MSVAARRKRDADPELAALEREFADSPPVGVAEGVIRRFGVDRVAVVSSFGAESALLLATVAEASPKVPVIFLETGKHFDETLAYRDRVVSALGLEDVRSVTPDSGDLSREDPDGELNRRDPDACCRIRKRWPLIRAMRGFDCWFTGRKRYQAPTREGLPVFERDEDGRVKVNPFVNWHPEDVVAEFRRRDLPVHPLVFMGYPSIGCAPCTAKPTTDDPRSGRWAGMQKTECGIHW